MNKIPHIGMRTVKTSLAVFVSLVIGWLMQGQSDPLCIAVAAIVALQPSRQDTQQAGINRLIGTAAGGMWGIVIFLANIFVLASLHQIVQFALIAAGIVVVILTGLGIKRPDSVGIACVVYLIITTAPVGELNPLKYMAIRLLDTFIGFAVAMALNSFRLPQENDGQP